jgi:replicative DNA helicase
LAQELNVREDALLHEINKIKEEKTYADLSQQAVKKALNINPTEQLLIKLMLEESELIGRIKNDLEPADFQDERASRIVSAMFDLAEQGRAIEPKSLMNHLKDEDFSRIICESMFLPDNLSGLHKEKVIDDCVQRLKEQKLKLRKQHLHEQIVSAQHSGDEERLNKLMEEFHYLIKKR